MSRDLTEITDVIHTYLDGLYRCDTQLLAKIFHPRAVYATAAGLEPLILSMQEYFPIVDKREPPARTNARRQEEILSIDVVEPATAMVKLTCSFFQKDFVDFLTLIRVEERWQIIAKVFHFEIVNRPDF